MFNQFYSWYRRTFNGFSETPPPDVWDAVSEYLEKHPGSVSKKPPIGGNRDRYFSFILPGIILLAAGGIAYYSGRTGNPLMSINMSPIKIHKADAGNTSISSPAEIHPQYGSPSENQIAALENRPENENRNKTSGAIPGANPNNKELNTAKENPHAVLQEEPTDFFPYSPVARSCNSSLFGENFGGDAIPAVNNPVLTSYAIEKSRNAFRGLYFGSAVVFNNSWLLNEDTYDGMKSKSLNRTNFYIGKTFFVTAGYNFTGHFGIQLEEIFNNKLGQNYTVYENGHLVNKKTELNFFQINALTKFRNPVWAFNGKHLFYWNKIAGIHYGDLRSANKRSDNENISVFSDYRKKTYGITLGVECELPLNQNWVIASSLLGNFDFNNVYTGNKKVPTSSANSTYISSFCLNFGVNYFLPEKD